MRQIIEEGKRTEIICDIEPWRTMLSDRVEIWLTFGKFSGIYEAALREEYELIEQSNYVATRLMNCEDDGAIIVSSE